MTSSTWVYAVFSSAGRGRVIAGTGAHRDLRHIDVHSNLAEGSVHSLIRRRVREHILIADFVRNLGSDVGDFRRIGGDHDRPPVSIVSSSVASLRARRWPAPPPLAGPRHK